MAAAIFRGGVEDDIGTQRNGALEHGGGEGVVDQEIGASGVGDFGGGSDVGDLQKRVGGSFGDYELGCRPNGGFDFGDFGHINDREFQVPLGQELAVEVAEAGVSIVGKDNVGAGLEGLQDRAEGAETGGKGQGGFAAFELGHGVFQAGLGRILLTDIGVAVNLLTGRAVGVSGGEVQRRGNGAGFAVDVSAGVDG